MHQPREYADAGCGTGFKRLSGGCSFSPAGDQGSGNPALAISRGSRNAPPRTPGHGRHFPGMLLSPSPFGSRSAIRPRNLPSSSSRLGRGYNRAPRGAVGACADGFVPCSTRGSSTRYWSRWWRGRSLERSGGAGTVEHPGLGGRRSVTNRETRARDSQTPSDCARDGAGRLAAGTRCTPAADERVSAETSVVPQQRYPGCLRPSRDLCST